MDGAENKLRGAAFGGFNRQDVLNYLERITAEHRERVSALEHELDETRRANAQAEDALARLRGENAALARDLASTCAELGERTVELEALRPEVEALRARAAELEPDAGAYRQLRERKISIEMEAHRVAQTVLDEADACAAEKRRQLARWAQGLNGAYDTLNTDVGATLSHLSGELERVRRMVDGMADELPRHAEALEQLSAACERPDEEPAPTE